MKNNKLFTIMLSAAIGGCSVKIAEIVKLKRMQKEHQEVLNDAEEEK